MSEIDWNMLRSKAFEVMAHAHAPYSRFPVGAAALSVDGRIVSGCNVENISYGLGLCAECVLVGNLRAAGSTGLAGVSVCDSRGEILMPCGRCRQVLYEHGGGAILIDHPDGPMPLRELLPYAFGPDYLAAGQL